MRARLVGSNLAEPLVFNAAVDAVTSATITSAVIFDAVGQGRSIAAGIVRQGLFKEMSSHPNRGQAFKIIDLSYPLHTGMPIFPGDRAPQFREISSLAAAGFRNMEMTFCTHLGTHIDTPCPYFSGGQNPGSDAGLSVFFGPACCLDLSAMPRQLIDIKDLSPFREMIITSEFVLLRTGWSRFWGTDEYYRGHPSLTREAAFWLAAFPLKGIGIDAASLDRADASHLSIHRVLLERNICLVENLTGLDQLPADGFMVSCLPLNLRGGDGCPVRAAAIIF